MGERHGYSSNGISPGYGTGDVIMAGKTIANSDKGQRSASDGRVLKHMNPGLLETSSDRVGIRPLVVVAKDCEHTGRRAQFRERGKVQGALGGSFLVFTDDEIACENHDVRPFRVHGSHDLSQPLRPHSHISDVDVGEQRNPNWLGTRRKIDQIDSRPPFDRYCRGIPVASAADTKKSCEDNG